MSVLLVALFGLLIGYPLVQLVSVVIARPRRRELRRLMAELRSDPIYTEKDLSVLDWTVGMERPHPVLSALLPLLAPIAVIAISVDILKGNIGPGGDDLDIRAGKELDDLKAQLKKLHDNPDSRIWSDERFDRARHLASEIEMIRLPITALISLIAFVFFSPVAFLAYGARVLKVSVLEAVFRASLTAIHVGARAATARI